MMLSDDFDEAMTYAYELEETNKDRQFIERKITIEAEQLVKEKYINDPGLVLYSPDWHSGVVGIVSGKFAKDFNRPAIVLGYESGYARGSGRTTNGVNLISILEKCSDLLEDWGGHPYAVGISLIPNNIDKFRGRFNELLRGVSSRNKTVEILDYSLEVQLEDIDNNFIQDLELLQPFGQKNLDPVFLVKNVIIGSLPETFGMSKQHVKFWLTDNHGRRLIIIGWNHGDDIPPINVPLDMLVTVSREKWNKTFSTYLSLVDWRILKK